MVDKYEISGGTGYKNQVYVLLSMEGNKWLYQGSILSKERINRCHIIKLNWLLFNVA